MTSHEERMKRVEAKLKDKRTHREKQQDLAPEWAKDWPTRIITALDWRYFAVAFKDMTKEAVIKDITTLPFEKTTGIGPGMRKQICELLGVEYREKPLTAAEQRIKELEARVAILEHIAGNVRSDPGDSDLVSYYKGWTILYPMYGGFKAAKGKNATWLEFKTFVELVNHIEQNP